MKLITKCQTCSAQIKTWNLSPDRGDFAKTTGEFVELNCTKCLTKNNYHVDDLEAAPSIVIYVIAAIIFFFGTLLLCYFIAPFLTRLTWVYSILSLTSIILVPVAVYSLLLKTDRDRVSRFNRYKFRR